MYTKYSILYTICSAQVYCIHNTKYCVQDFATRSAAYDICGPVESYSILRVLCLLAPLNFSLEIFLAGKYPYLSMRMMNWLTPRQLFCLGSGKIFRRWAQKFLIPPCAARGYPPLFIIYPLSKTDPLYAAWNQIKFLRMRVLVRAPR